MFQMFENYERLLLIARTTEGRGDAASGLPAPTTDSSRYSETPASRPTLPVHRSFSDTCATHSMMCPRRGQGTSLSISGERKWNRCTSSGFANGIPACAKPARRALTRPFVLQAVGTIYYPRLWSVAGRWR